MSGPMYDVTHLYLLANAADEQFASLRALADLVAAETNIAAPASKRRRTQHKRWARADRRMSVLAECAARTLSDPARATSETSASSSATDAVPSSSHGEASPALFQPGVAPARKGTARTRSRGTARRDTGSSECAHCKKAGARSCGLTSSMCGNRECIDCGNRHAFGPCPQMAVSARRKTKSRKA